MNIEINFYDKIFLKQISYIISKKDTRASFVENLPKKLLPVCFNFLQQSC